MAALVSLTGSDAIHILAGFNAPVAAVDHAWGWSVVTAGAALGVAVVKATLRDGGQFVDLIVSPGMSEGQTYTFTAVHATLPDGTPLAAPDKTAAFVNGAHIAGAPDIPYRLFEALVLTAAEETTLLVGKPQTLVVDEWWDAWDVLPVESTWRFPPIGAFWADGRKYTYTAKDTTAFRGVAPVFPSVGVQMSPKTLVTLDLASVA